MAPTVAVFVDLDALPGFTVMVVSSMWLGHQSWGYPGTDRQRVAGFASR